MVEKLSDLQYKFGPEKQELHTSNEPRPFYDQQYNWRRRYKNNPADLITHFSQLPHPMTMIRDVLFRGLDSPAKLYHFYL